MADNGVALPTALSQIDNIAKVQLKAQQPHHPNGPLAEEITQSRQTKVERVQKADQAEKGQVRPEERKERRHDRRPDGRAAAEPAEDAAGDAPPEPGESPESLGLHVDTKA